jgi:NAD(P)-dependent dehydrogenase (short-subunit alcohol dehydrogenase family)
VFDLSEKVAAITGAGSGIGRAIAMLFGRQGAYVVPLDIDERAARQTADAILGAGGKNSRSRCCECRTGGGRI